MKKVIVMLTAATVSIGVYASVPRQIQGIPYTPKKTTAAVSPASEYQSDPDDLAVPDGNFTFDMIQSWSGEGSKKAALVIQWNDLSETYALVFGYRWDGEATGADMLRAVTTGNPQLYSLVQYTNVSSPTDPDGGYTVNGIGWDKDADGDIALIDTGHGNQMYNSETGLFIHPRGYVPGQGGSPDYDYDNWKAADTDDYWGAGWYSAYWSYWVKGSSDSTFGYSSLGASGRVLTDGCWDGWNFAVDMMSAPWKSFKAAPAPIPEGALTEFKVDGLYYKLGNYAGRTVALVAPFVIEGETLDAYSGDVTVPATIEVDGNIYSVTEIRPNTFENAQIGTVTLPTTVKKIGDYAFKGSTLSKLAFPEDAVIPSLGKGVFSGCSVFTQFILPENIKTIPDELYSGTAITAVSIPDGVESIGTRSFANCQKLATLVIPASVKAIGAEAFAGCDALYKISVSSTYPPACAADAFSQTAYSGATLAVPMGFTQSYAAAQGWNGFSKHDEFGISVNVGDFFALNGVSYKILSIAEGNMNVCATYHKPEGAVDRKSIATANLAGYTGNVIIPTKVSYQGKIFNVSSLNDSIFYGAAEMTSAVLPDGLVSIPRHAFYECSKLEKVEIPATVTSIGAYAFTYCSVIDNIQLPERLTSLGDRCFFQTPSLSNINIPAGLTTLPQYCFSYSGLNSIVLGENITTLGNYCFQTCKKLESIVLPSNLKAIPNNAFQNCSSLRTITIPESVTSLGTSAFAGCSLIERITLPKGLTGFSSSMFQNCSSLKEISIPETIVNLGSNVFNGCSSLEKVTLSPNVTAIPSNAFTNCTRLHTITYHGRTEPEEPGVIRLADGTKSIAQYAFQGCTAIKDIILPEDFTTIGGREVFKNTGITRLVIPASVTSMSQNYICGNNEAVTFYFCGTQPVKINKFTLAKASGNYSFPVVVPTDYAETYKNASNWNFYSISEPVISGLVLSDVKLTDGKLSGRLTLNYSTELPARFAAANSTIFFDGATVSVTLTNESTEHVKVEITIGADGSFETAIEDFKAKKGLLATASIVKGTTSYVSEPTTVDAELYVPFAYSKSEYDAHFDEKFTPEIVFEDETYTSEKISYSSSNTDVAAVNAKTGLVTVKRTSGDAIIRAYVTEEPDIFAEMTLHAALRKPVERYVLGDGSENITLSYLDILALCPTIEPVDADIQTYDISISDPEIATVYSVTAFNPTRKFFELVTHKTGTVDITFKSQDGSGIQTTYHVTVAEPDRTVADDSWQDGTFWLNEEWFGHSNGSINYITADGNIRYRAYESQNAYESFGGTSQYAMIFGGKLYVMSKQASDSGDPRKGGGRLVVADAKSLKKLAAFDDILDGGDGRACVGVNASKVYLGTTAGIAIFNPETLEITGKVDGIEPGAKYANQIGDMVCAGRYVFAIKQNFGTLVIDTETDTVLKVLGKDDAGTTTAFPQGVTMTADGNVWVAATDGANSRKTSLFCYAPTDLSLVKIIEMPAYMSITCGWGSWRPTNFFSENDETAIWFGSGADNSIVSGDTGYYRWDTKADLSTLTPVFIFPSDLDGIDSNTKQSPYAGVRYDGRNNRLLVAATHGSSSNYRYNWLHFIDCASGKIAKTIHMKDYYWFPAMPVFPDKYATEFETIEPIELEMTKNAEGICIDLGVSDRDNMDSAIRVSIMEDDLAESTTCFKASLEGRRLTIVPLATGNSEIGLCAESNGVLTYLSVPVTVSNTSSAISNTAFKGSLSITGRRFHASGFNGHTMCVYNAAGSAVAEFEVASDDFSILLPIESGFYIIADKDSNRTIKCIIK